MGEAESGGKDDTIQRLQIYMKYKCLNTKVGKAIQSKQHMVHVNLQDRHKKCKGNKINISDIKRKQKVFSIAPSISVTLLKLHYQVTLGHTGTLIRISGFLYFQSQLESWTEVDAMRLTEAAAFGRSHTEHFSFPFNT